MPTEYVFDSPSETAPAPAEPATPAPAGAGSEVPEGLKAKPLLGSDDGGAADPASQPTEAGGEAAGGPGATPLAGAVPLEPEGYALNFAEGTEVDTALLGTFQATAHELGLTVGQAQKLADLYAGHAAEQARSFQEAQFKALDDYITAQNAELAKRPDFQAELTLAKKTLREFGSKDLADALTQTAMGSHPALFDFMVKVGKALGEPELRGGPGGPAEAVPLQDRLWPSMR